VAKRMGFAEFFSYATPAEIFAEYAALSAFENHGTRDFDIGAFADIDAARFDDLTPFQWPRPTKSAPEATRFFADGGFYTADRKARFIAVTPSVAARTTADLPFVLNTGRVRDHWHTMTRTAKSPRLSQHLAEPFAEIHPHDAAKLGIGDADIVRVSTNEQSVLVRALLSPRQARGAIFVPMHWNDQFAAQGRIDRLVPATTDPQSGQPAFKHVGVGVTRFPAARYGFAVLRQRPRGLDADYWALAKCRDGWRLELAFAHAPHDWSDFAVSLFGAAPGADILSYQDASSDRHRFACFKGEHLAGALFLAAEPVPVSRDWAVEQLSATFADPRRRLSIIAARPGAGSLDRGATVCSCFGVGAKQIAAAVAAGCTSVEAIGQSTQAGTNCGSCRAEIRKIIDVNLPDALQSEPVTALG